MKHILWMVGIGMLVLGGLDLWHMTLANAAPDWPMTVYETRDACVYLTGGAGQPVAMAAIPRAEHAEPCDARPTYANPKNPLR